MEECTAEIQAQKGHFALLLTSLAGTQPQGHQEPQRL